MFVILWEFTAKSGAEIEFENAYGPGGSWVQLFKTAQDYVGTEFYRDLDKPRFYVTVDRWRSKGAYETFRDEHRGEYQIIDEKCRALTDEERHVGSFIDIQ